VRVFILGDREWSDETAIQQTLSYFSDQDYFLILQHYVMTGITENVLKYLVNFHFKYELLPIVYTGGPHDTFRQMDKYLRLSNVGIVLMFHDTWKDSRTMILAVRTCKRQGIVCINIRHNIDGGIDQVYIHDGSTKVQEK